MTKQKSEKCAKIIKNLNALGHLITNIKFNYGILCSVYEQKDKIDDVEYKDFECALNNFILTASIVKQHIKSFEKDLDETFIKTKKYQKVKTALFDNEWHLILLGLRNYIQHVFHIKISFGNALSESPDEEDLFITNFTLIKHKELHTNKPENIALNNYFKYCFALPIMPFATENMCLIDRFYKQYDKVVHEHYKSILAKYNSVKDVDQYAMDMHDIYFANLNSFKD